MSKTIIAAGAVVWRKSESGQVEVVLIHRPKYDDWSFPKGKADLQWRRAGYEYETRYQIKPLL